ncbi:MAG: hypothetical protein KDK70_17915 [Myxococcales bacterium]|nr:hypothetical protein [Myxococcales bacterium]
MTIEAAAAKPTVDPWSWLETHYDDAVIIRAAQTMADAQAARELIRKTWEVETDERYFYGVFDDARLLFETVIAPSREHGDLRELDAICMMIEATDERGRRQAVGTFSFVLDHEAKTIEVGRGAIAPAWQHRGIPARALGPMHRLLATVPEYAVITDATTIARGAKATADALGLPAVALHPSNFTVQARAVDPWLRRLARRRGSALARALLRRSERTGLGRFTTSYHCRVPRDLEPTQPVLTAAQQPFFAHTCRVSKLAPSRPGRAPQRARLRRVKVHDHPHTATRTIVDPRPAFDVEDQLVRAAEEGLETMVIQVPCDAQHRALSQRLERAGAILGGVFVDAHGYWRASYTLLTTEVHDAQVRLDLAMLVTYDALDGDAGALLRLVQAHARRRLDEAG